ncbi:pyrroloquinoline quinone biosynthesis protein PqqB [Carboxydochorda subterranea]|uniref:Coenzyme PQQ synthesis protein B n=1 Tax=Carboxydichorda subterranea TaxID=3109565 RepID=A0ABZ1BY54_9FIRM|nr:pyrroloquinoline quinone biosynthesis protein PqqB [Limnochorda sp. L945t]WRP17476.1 pyrroloquinoline quinone biosynthesis protein PqqB [Limnochorda sp. L945t]
MRIRVLGTTAGGGLPQWNCNCANCRRARAAGPSGRRLQSSLAVSPDGAAWYLINATPDVREQMAHFRALAPGPGIRDTPLRGVLLTDAELDHTLGLLNLRENARWTLWATPAVLHVLESVYPVLPILRAYSSELQVRAMPVDRAFMLPPERAPGASVQVLATEVSRRLPVYAQALSGAPAPGAVVAFTLTNPATGRRLVYAPGLRRLEASLRAQLEQADVVLLDGTLWDEDELIRLGVAHRTAADMDHAPMNGSHGTARWFGELPARWKLYVHVNNTNPALDPSSPERRRLREAGLDIAEDGWEVEL